MLGPLFSNHNLGIFIDLLGILYVDEVCLINQILQFRMNNQRVARHILCTQTVETCVNRFKYVQQLGMVYSRIATLNYKRTVHVQKHPIKVQIIQNMLLILLHIGSTYLYWTCASSNLNAFFSFIHSMSLVIC